MPRRCRFVSCLWFVCLSAGCGGGETSAEPDETEKRLRSIRLAYGMAMNELRRPPKDAKEIRAQLVKMEIPNPDDELTSARDGQPFVIVGGVFPKDMPESAKEARFIAYERVGSGGRKLGIDLRGLYFRVTDAELAGLKFPPGHLIP